MPDPHAPSEFGGKVLGPHGIQPRKTPNGKAGHDTLTPGEQLRMLYRTGQTDTQEVAAKTDVDTDAYDVQLGFLPISEQEALRRAAGDLDKGVLRDAQ